jgi:hypothetical protein
MHPPFLFGVRPAALSPADAMPACFTNGLVPVEQHLLRLIAFLPAFQKKPEEIGCGTSSGL